MASNYPASLDTTATLPAAGSVGANLSTFPHSTLHGNADDAIIAIETELGVAPSGAETTVKARLDRITPTLGALTSWSPTLTQSGTVTATNTYSRYIRIGRLIIGWFQLAVTGAGTAGNPVTVNVPVAAVGTTFVGGGEVFDTSASARYNALLFMPTTATVDFRASAISGVLDNRIGIAGSGFSAALASGDGVSGFFSFEAAAD